MSMIEIKKATAPLMQSGHKLMVILAFQHEVYSAGDDDASLVGIQAQELAGFLSHLTIPIMCGKVLENVI